MSDGPYRSLPMSPGWKKLALYVDKPAFPLEEVGDAMSAALVTDWKRELPGPLLENVLRIACDRQGSLLHEQRIEQLQALQPDISGLPFASVFLNCVIRGVDLGRCDHSIVIGAARDALSDRVSRCMRQIEEHCLRKCSDGRVNLRDRLELVASQFDYSQLAKHLVGSNGTARRGLKGKKTGLEDGVPLG